MDIYNLITIREGVFPSRVGRFNVISSAQMEYALANQDMKHHLGLHNAVSKRNAQIQLVTEMEIASSTTLVSSLAIVLMASRDHVVEQRLIALKHNVVEDYV